MMCGDFYCAEGWSVCDCSTDWMWFVDELLVVFCQRSRAAKAWKEEGHCGVLCTWRYVNVLDSNEHVILLG